MPVGYREIDQNEVVDDDVVQLFTMADYTAGDGDDTGGSDEMTSDERERIRALEVRADQTDKVLTRLIATEQQISRYVAAQEERNRIELMETERKLEDRWQIWVRWAVNPGIPVVAIVLWVAKEFPL